MTQKPDDLDLIMLSIQDYNLKHKGEEQLVLAGGEVFKCSNPHCDAIWDKNPHGHCPACVNSDGIGWSTRTMRLLALSAAKA